MASDNLRLAVLSALIAKYGPIPCIHVASVQKLQPTTMGANALGQVHQFRTRVHRCEASELVVVQSGQVVLALCHPPGSQALAEPTEFQGPGKAAKRRDKLCGIYLRLPWDRTALGNPLKEADAIQALQHIKVSGSGVVVFPESTPEISAITFEESQKGSSQETP